MPVNNQKEATTSTNMPFCRTTPIPQAPFAPRRAPSTSQQTSNTQRKRKPLAKQDSAAAMPPPAFGPRTQVPTSTRPVDASKVLSPKNSSFSNQGKEPSAESPVKGSLQIPEFPQLLSMLFYKQYYIKKASNDTRNQHLLPELLKEEQEILAQMDAYQKVGMSPVVMELARERTPLPIDHPGVKSLEEHIPLRRVIVNGGDYCGRVPLVDRMRFKLPPPPRHLRSAIPLRFEQDPELPNWEILEEKERVEIARAMDAAALARQDSIDDRILDDKEDAKDLRSTLATDYAPTTLEPHLDEVYFYASFADVPRPTRPAIKKGGPKKSGAKRNGPNRKAIDRRVNELARMYNASSKSARDAAYSAPRIQEITGEEEEDVLPQVSGLQMERKSPSPPPRSRRREPPQKRFTFLEQLSAPRPGMRNSLPTLAHMNLHEDDEDDTEGGLRVEFDDNPLAGNVLEPMLYKFMDNPSHEEEAQRLERIRTNPVLYLASRWMFEPNYFGFDNDKDIGDEDEGDEDEESEGEGEGEEGGDEGDKDEEGEEVDDVAGSSLEEEEEVEASISQPDSDEDLPTRTAEATDDDESGLDLLPPTDDRCNDADPSLIEDIANESPLKRKRSTTPRAEPSKKAKLAHVAEPSKEALDSRVSSPKRKRTPEVGDEENDADISNSPAKKTRSEENPATVEEEPSVNFVPFGPTHRAQTPPQKPRLSSAVARFAEEIAANRTPSPEPSFDVNPTEREKDLKRKRQQYKNDYLPYRIRYGPPPETTTWDRVTFQSEFPESSIEKEVEEGVYEMGKNPALEEVYKKIQSGEPEESTFPLEELGDVQDDDDGEEEEIKVKIAEPTLVELASEGTSSVLPDIQTIQAMLEASQDRRRQLLELLNKARTEVSLSWGECTLLRDEAKREFDKWSKVLTLAADIAGPDVAQQIEDEGDFWIETKGKPWEAPEMDDDAEEAEESAKEAEGGVEEAEE